MLTVFDRAGLKTANLDRLTFRQVLQLRIDKDMIAVLRCPNCGRRAQHDWIGLIERFSGACTLGELRARSRCLRCGRRNPQVYFWIPGRDGGEWWPSAPTR